MSELSLFLNALFEQMSLYWNFFLSLPLILRMCAFAPFVLLLCLVFSSIFGNHGDFTSL